MNNSNSHTNSTFDFQRWLKLLKFDLALTYRKMRVIVLVFFLIPFLQLVFGNGSGFDPDYIVVTSELGTILFFTLVAAVVAPSVIYTNVNVPRTGVYFSMLPASVFEKFLSMSLITLVVVPGVTFVGMLIADYLVVTLQGVMFQKPVFSAVCDLFGIVSSQTPENVNYIPNQTSWDTVVLACAVVASFLFSNTVFKRHKVFKTILCYIVLAIVWAIFLVSSFLSQANLPEMWSVPLCITAFALFLCGTLYRMKKMEY